MDRDLDSIAFVGNYLPRRCGIATFTTDLCEAVAGEARDVTCVVAALNDRAQGYPYPSRVRFEITQNDVTEYTDAAAYLNFTRNDVVCVQHEYGIFGGSAGSHILSLLSELRMPIVTTLHTVLREPDESQRAVLVKLANLSDRLVVMSMKAVGFLQDVYGIPEEKIAFIHHGVPDMPFLDPNYFKDLFGVEGRRVILTFGLLSPDKTIEHAIQALPEVVKKHPDVVYIVLGATHPHIIKQDGEKYRFFLQRLVKELGLDNHVVFYNRFVEAEELRSFLGVADICITPYSNEQQITSGTLAYYVGTGKAVVSTPYWYAQELLAEGRGSLVPFADPDGIADVLINLLDNEAKRHAMRKMAYALGRQMIWSEIANRYLELFTEVCQARDRVPRKVSPLPPLADMFVGEIPVLDFCHLERLTDDTGLMQSAKYTIPDRRYGYSTDDNARALAVVVRALRVRPLVAADLKLLAPVYMSFLDQAFDKDSARFRSTMDFSRQWIDKPSSEDCYGRVLYGLGTATALTGESGVVSLASGLFQQALPTARSLSSVRAIASCVIGICEYLERFGGDSEAHRVLDELAARLLDVYRTNATAEWPWLEETLTYANATVPHALLMYGRRVGHEEMVETGLSALGFLVHVQKSPEGYFEPIGTHGWHPRRGSKARFDQMPVEAQTMIDACEQAWRITKDTKWLTVISICYEWFLGRNDLGTSLYDHTSGGCRDSLLRDRPNENQGAEATIAFLRSTIAIEQIKSELGPRSGHTNKTNGTSKD